MAKQAADSKKGKKSNVLAGFAPADIGVVRKKRQRPSCESRALLDAFLASGEECLSKPMPDDELKRMSYNLRAYRRTHSDEFADVGIAARNGALILFRRVD